MQCIHRDPRESTFRQGYIVSAVSKDGRYMLVGEKYGMLNDGIVS
jgi:hypothetical protein